MVVVQGVLAHRFLGNDAPDTMRVFGFEAWGPRPTLRLRPAQQLRCRRANYARSGVCAIGGGGENRAGGHDVTRRHAPQGRAIGARDTGARDRILSGNECMPANVPWHDDDGLPE